MNWIKKLFVSKSGKLSEKKSINLTISSENPKASEPYVSILKLETDYDKSEWEEGYSDGTIDAKTSRDMVKNLNYPVHPYARGYMEGYRSHKKTNA